VVDHGGNLFINTLGDGSIHMIDPAGHQSVVLRGLQSPQGLALDGADNIVYTDTGGSIGRLARTFFLDRPVVTKSGQGLVVICPALRRAGGYTDPLELSVVPSTGVTVVSLVQPSGDQSGQVEVRRAAGAAAFVDLRLRAGLLEIRQRVRFPAEAFHLPLIKAGPVVVVPAHPAICDVAGPRGQVTWRALHVRGL